MPITATVGGKTGPGNTVTGQTFSDVADLDIDIAHKVIRIDDNLKGFFEVDLQAAATVTITLSGAKDLTITIT